MRDGWAVVKLAEIADRKTLKNISKIDLVFTVSAQRGLITQEEYFTKRVASSNLTNYFVVQPGDYVFNKSYSVDAPFGVIAKNTGNSPGLVSPLYIVFGAKSEIIDRDFLGLGLTSTIFWKSLEGSLKEGGRGHGALNLKVGDFFEALLPLPPLPEQKRIVDLVASVDSYIEALQQHLDSAKRTRNAVLHDLFSANDSWPEIGLEDLENSGVIKLGRGDVISKKDMEADPGPNPVYSSAENKNGMIGQYAKFMFDEELITWSIDGGGHIFYRPKHKFSVTNIGGWLRILDDSIFSYNFLTLALQRLHTQHHFDWQSKAHPSVLRTLYNQIPSPPLTEQNRIVGIISAIDEQIKQSSNAVRVARELRSGLLSDLVSGEHEIPADYDKAMGAA